MTRLSVPTVFLILLSGAASAQTPPPTQTPPTQTPPPPAQTPKPPVLPTGQTPAATPVPFPAEAKFAFVDMQVVVSSSKLGKAGQERMKALTEQENADLSAKSKQIQSLQQEISTQGAVLAPAVMASKNSELDKLQRAAQFAQQDWGAQVDSLNKQLLQDFQEKVLPVLETLRTEKGLLVIFSVSESGAVAVHPGLNLSQELISRLDVKYPGK
jgi:outer membrane protein